MTLALLPIGSVAIFQTNRVADEAERNAELALLALTERAARTERLLIEGAFVAARFLAENAQDFIANPRECTSEMQRFVASNPSYSFAGLLPVSGLMTCASNGQTFDFSEFPDFDENIAAQQPSITVNADAPMSGKSVFIISYPYEIDGRFGGFVSVSIPHDLLNRDRSELLAMGLEDLLTFNDEGLVLTSRTDQGVVQQLLPATEPLQALAAETGRAFQDRSNGGDLFTYTVVQIEGSPAGVIGVWRSNDPLDTILSNLIIPGLFPVLMWLASITVAMLAIYTLVTRHVLRLRRAMDAFSDDRKNVLALHDGPMPNELRALHENFTRMTGELLQDEARLEDALQDKSVLLKEVHHRVKNNLQLISSIMNMQIRNAEHDETKFVLSRVQDRVLSLATIHRDLYQSQHGGLVDVGALVSEIVEKSVELVIQDANDVRVDTRIEKVMLYPDQAVPLSLMVSEAMTNVLKYLGEGETPWIKVDLTRDGNACKLVVANSVGAHGNAESTGLGAQLINAFSIQLGSTVDIDQQPGSYTMTVDFKAKEFEDERRDY
ncbi:sensor histidine kinase [Yoonia sp. 2307UL14-13]|uniref:sensor histidine kinase n=1 Tax=Yoonia sp. 2307UL14-13 TaxID=3126506 RepID=UPI0030AB3E42